MATYDESFLTRSITDVRESVDEPIINAKYTDARIIRHLEKAFILVLNEKNRNSKTPATVKQTIAITANTTEYVLPYVMGSFLGIYNRSDSGTKIQYDGRGHMNPFGRGVWLEDHTLHIQSADSLGLGTSLVAEWIPNGVARLHNGTCIISDDGKTVTFGTTNAGALDTHVQAYAGSKFRILLVDGLEVSGNYMQERNITAYDHVYKKATLDVALNPVPTTDETGHIYYEIAPFISQAMDSVVPLYAAYRIASVEGNRKRAKGILDAYRNEIRNVRLTEYYSNMPEAPRLRGDSFDNRRYRRI